MSVQLLLKQGVHCNASSRYWWTRWFLWAEWVHEFFFKFLLLFCDKILCFCRSWALLKSLSLALNILFIEFIEIWQTFCLIHHSWTWLCWELSLSSLRVFKNFYTWFCFFICTVHSTVVVILFNLNVVILAWIVVSQKFHPLQDIRLPYIISFFGFLLLINFNYLWVVVVPCLIADNSCLFMLLCLYALRLLVFHLIWNFY